MLLSKTVKMKVGNRGNYYHELGYDIPMKLASSETKRKTGKEYVFDRSAEIEIDVNDLLEQSNVMIQLSCDFCGTIFSRKYAYYINSMKSHGKVACSNCRINLTKETCMEKYGVPYSSGASEVKEKVKHTFKERYGVDCYMRSEDFRKKAYDTKMQKWGTQNLWEVDDIVEKRKQTCLERYGVPYAGASKEIHKKMQNTILERYGVENVLLLPEIREKIKQVQYENSNIKSSRPQIYIYNLFCEYYDVKLNYPIKYYNGDIVDIVNKVDIEINYGGHFIPIITGKITKQEYENRELRRAYCIIDNGYKILRIISKEDSLPTDNKLLSMYNKSLEIFSEGYNWIDFDIDKELYFYAGNKDGVYYDFGNLRRIRKNGITNHNRTNIKMEGGTNGSHY